jgi:hypothetical protein
MKQRCNDPNAKDYKKYGGRGITVCERWDKSFMAFWEDMKNTYQDCLSLDRINNNGPYSPENCRWATKKVQANNTRVNKYVNTPDGKVTVSEAARRSGLIPGSVFSRLRRGWTITDALSIPMNKNRRRSLMS